MLPFSSFLAILTAALGNISTTLDYIYVHDFVAPTITTEKEVYEIEVNTPLTSKQIENYFTAKDNFTIPIGIKKTYTDNYQDQYNKVGEYSFTCQVILVLKL